MRIYVYADHVSCALCCSKLAVGSGGFDGWMDAIREVANRITDSNVPYLLAAVFVLVAVQS